MPASPPVHRYKRQNRVKTRQTEERGTAHARGYGHKWRLIRGAFLAHTRRQQGYIFACCVVCLNEGKRVRATDVDHIKPKSQGGSDKFDNLQPLCHSCHSKKTRREN